MDRDDLSVSVDPKTDDTIEILHTMLSVRYPARTTVARFVKAMIAATIEQIDSRAKEEKLRLAKAKLNGIGYHSCFGKAEEEKYRLSDFYPCLGNCKAEVAPLPPRDDAEPAPAATEVKPRDVTVDMLKRQLGNILYWATCNESVLNLLSSHVGRKTILEWISDSRDAINSP